MSVENEAKVSRRELLREALAAGAAATLAHVPAARAGTGPGLEAGEGVVDTTPPLSAELGGFHRPPGQERRVEGIRHRTAARALVLRVGEDRAAIVSLDIAAVSVDFSRRVARRVAETTGIPAGNVRICATHTHSMPGFQPLRQWGAVPVDYMATVESAIVRAVGLALEDLAPARLHLGTARAAGANFNRTTPKFKTDEQFGREATDADRWLDTTLHAMRFERAGIGGRKAPDLVWYHFSAHPVCYGDTQAGPDWPGIVQDLLVASHGVSPSFLQGHAGDVNPGDGKPWMGDPTKTANAVHAALKAALEGARPVKVDGLRMQAARFEVPIDLDRLRGDLARYRKDPDRCTTGEWVDAGFAKEWHEAASKWKPDSRTLAFPVSTLRLGELGWFFHPTELFSFYGLKIRQASPTPHTLLVGYTDGIIGYLSDPEGYKAGIYEAVVVPKILDLPPFAPTAAADFTGQALNLVAKNLA